MVYVYFLFSILYSVVSLCASIAFLVQIGRGSYREYVNQYCTVNAPSFGKFDWRGRERDDSLFKKEEECCCLNED